MTGCDRARRLEATARYFVFEAQVLVDALHSPPALTQSAWVVIFDRSVVEVEEPDEVDGLDGLADGELDEPLVDDEPVVPALPALLPELPELLGVLLEPPAPLLLLPLEPLVWAAAMAGASAITAINDRNRTFLMVSLL
jgi:hypothetical protein